MNAVLLTGSTGLLGRHLLRDLLLSGREVAVLVRESIDGMPSRLRIDQVLRHFESQLQRTLPRPRVLEGTLHSQSLGLSSSDRSWVRTHCDSVLHSAASLQFSGSEGRSGEPYTSNVDGTLHLLEFCREAGIRHFHHVSTAYVCGTRTDTIMEADFDRHQQFKNDYERSKFEAEQILRNSTDLTSLTFYRPSVVVGDFRTGYTSTFHGFYLPLQLAHALVKTGFRRFDNLAFRSTLRVHGAERKNLVPVDWVSVALVRIFCQPTLHNKTYHLVNPIPVTTAAIEAAIGEAVRAEVPVDRAEPSLSPAQLESFKQQMGVYNAYLSDDPEFDSSNTTAAVPELPCPQFDHESLLRLARFAIRANFGWPRPPMLPAEFDVEPLMQQLPWRQSIANPDNILRIHVGGSCGGIWTVGLDGGCVIQLDSSTPAFDAYFNVFTLRRILQGQQSVRAALADGRVVLQSLRDGIARGPDLLEALFSRLRETM